MATTATRHVYKTPEHAARAYARRAGLTGHKDGWLKDASGRVVCQGYGAYADALRARRLIVPHDNGFAIARMPT